MTKPPPAVDPLARLALFARLLRDCGLRTTPRRLADAALALECIDMRLRGDVRAVLGGVFVSRREELAVFDAAFDVFFASPEPRRTAGAIPQRTRGLPLDPRAAAFWKDALGMPASQLPRVEDESTPVHSSGYSAQELLRRRDFSEMSWEEEQQIRRLLRQAPWRVAQRRTRRLEPARRGALNMRRTLRRAAREGGEPLRLARSRPRRHRRPLVLICDVSGSMDRVSRQLLAFAHAVGRRERVETFVFSTRLTRVTHLLRRRDIDEALAQTARQVHDIGGGTRIGEALWRFNRDHARRVLGHGAVVLVLSDGWDRGDVDLLATEMARLHRLSHRLIWLNPLLGSASYSPQTRGMAAALPHVDDFLAAHNLEALDELGRRLAALPERRRRVEPGRALSGADAGPAGA
jgi:uncharacterized protein with von Willebrand factor type A (vWA) domain